MTGRVEAIFIGPVWQAPMHAVDEIEVVTHRGIRGDRYYLPDDEPPRSDGSDLTLFEAEALQAVLDDHGISLEPHEMRRNVMTREIRLNKLVGHRIRVGEVEGHGVELSNPCNHLQKLTKPGVLRALVGRGGLRADVPKGGVIRLGDTVEDLGPV